jgi:hypothetical protein
MKLFSTRMHGMLDYLTVGILFTLPRALGWSGQVTRMMSSAALSTLGYSLLTRYELGLFKVLPMKAHLALDAMSGAAFCSAPWLFPNEEMSVTGTMAGLGLFEIAVALTTETEPTFGEQVDPYE